MYVGGRVYALIAAMAAMAGLEAFIKHVRKNNAGKSLVMQ